MNTIDETETMLPNGRKATPPETEGATDGQIVDRVTAGIVARYNIADASIAELRKKAEGLKIAGTSDKKGYELVRSTRLEIVAIRGGIEKTRKQLKADSLEYGRKVDGEAKRITSELEDIEAPLDAEESRIDQLVEEEKARKQQIINDLVTARVAALTAVDAPNAIHPLELPGMPEADFQAHLSVATTAFNAKKAKEAEAAAELERLRKLEAEQKAKEAAEMEEKRKAMEAQQAEINRRQAEQEAVAAKQRAESERLERDKREAEEAKRREAEAKTRAEEMEKAKAEAAEKARIATIAEEQAKAKREAERLEAERAEAERLAALAPEREQVIKFLDALGAIIYPEVKDERLDEIITEVALAISNARDKV